MVTILLQQKGAGAGSLFGGGESTFYHTKRGLEQALFILTIVLGIVFIALAILSLNPGQTIRLWLTAEVAPEIQIQPGVVKTAWETEGFGEILKGTPTQLVYQAPPRKGSWDELVYRDPGGEEVFKLTIFTRGSALDRLEQPNRSGLWGEGEANFRVHKE